MTNQDDYPMDPADLHQKAEELAMERAVGTPEGSADLSPEEMRKTIHELRLQQIELQRQNEELRTDQAVIDAVRARYFDLYDLAPVGYCTLSEKGLILEANLTAATLLSSARSALVNQLISRFILKEDQDIYYLHQKQLFETGKTQECDLRLVKPDGTFFWTQLKATVALADDCAPVGRVTFSDISERKQADELLRKSEEMYQSLSENMPVMVCRFLSDFTLTYMNRAYSNYFGKMPEELLGVSYLTLIPEAGHEAAKAVIVALDSERPVAAYDYQAYAADGSIRWQRWTDRALFDDQGSIFAYQAVGEDITERKRAQLALQQKNIEIEQFVNVVSHDLKSPLVTISSFLEMLQQDIAGNNTDTERIEKDVSFIRGGINRMDQLVSALLQLSRTGRNEAEPQRISLQSLINSSLAAVAGPIRENGIDVVTEPHDLQLYGDPLQLGQIWQNLIENAIKYRGDQPEPRIVVGVDLNTREPEFFICDNGIGIAPEHNERIFGLFAQLNPDSDGCGLGLSLVKKIVTIYHGRIWVESDGKGRGSCFLFTLPEAFVKKGTAT